MSMSPRSHSGSRPDAPPRGRLRLDSSTTTGGLQALSHVLAEYGAERLLGHGGKGESGAAFRAAARQLAVESRAEDPVRAERLIIGLRSAWRELPQVRALDDRESSQALWQRLVRLCCEEFYEGSAQSS